MALRIVACPACTCELPSSFFQQELSAPPQPCPACQRPLQALVFPALAARGAVSHAGELALGEADTTCFYHAQRQAVAVCAACGRFLCALCDLDLHGQHLCPGCLDSGKKKGRLVNLENERTLHGGIALGAAVLPLLVWPFTLLSAPFAIYYSIRHWNSPGSLLGRSRGRFVVALIFALLQVAGWITLFVYLLYGRHR